MKPSTGINVVWLVIVLGALVVGSAMLVWSSMHLASVDTRHRSEFRAAIERVDPDLPIAKVTELEQALEMFTSGLSRETFKDALVRDLGIAFLVAFFLTVVMEWYARTRLQEEVRSGVVEATLKRFIPEVMFEEVHRSVMSAKLLKKGWRIEMALHSDPMVSKEDPSLYVSHTVLSYELLNLTGSPVQEIYSSGLDEDVVARDARGPLPRFNQIVIGDQVFTGDAIEKRLSYGNGIHFQVPFTVGRGATQITVDVTEVVRVPDTFTWSTSRPTEGFAVSIESDSIPDIRFSVLALHPDRYRLKETVPGRRWEFPRGILPWQGFQVTSHRVKALSAGGPAAPEDSVESKKNASPESTSGLSDEKA